jgi:hypothetical protein
MCSAVHALHIPPRKELGQRKGIKVRMRRRRRNAMMVEERRVERWNWGQWGKGIGKNAN